MIRFIRVCPCVRLERNEITLSRCITDCFIIAVCPDGSEGKVTTPDEPEFPFDEKEAIFSPDGTIVGPQRPIELTPMPEVCKLLKREQYPLSETCCQDAIMYRVATNRSSLLIYIDFFIIRNLMIS